MDDLLELTGRAEATHFWFRGFRKFIAPVIADLANGRPGLRLVDCGCGTGHNLQLLRPHGRAIGFDLGAAGPARAHAAGLTVLRGDVTRIPLASGSFDVATSFDVLQCVEADVAAVREMARIVRPGGVVVVTLAALNVLRGDHAEVWQEVRRYTPASARRLVETAGLRPERVSFLFASLFPLMASVRLVQRVTRRFGRTVREDTDIKVPVAPINLLLTTLVSAEAALVRHVPMPIGSSLLVVARKG
ncbi:MAG TPA: class I SAM-dependent methyltransferase [Vicinamibacterales bacterium]|nr:class I SAM-dependent methyltransferase [Vicinamibacterales bacterium]